MRSYETARGLFTFFAFLGWSCVAGGIALAVLGGNAALEMARYGNGALFFAAVGAGIVVVLVGIVIVAMAQVGRAGVDTAEYTQQMLVISREHFDVSRQSLRQSEQIKAGFDALRTAVTEKPMADYGSRPAQGEHSSLEAQANPQPTVTYAATKQNHVISSRPQPTALSAGTPELGLPGLPLASSRDTTT